MTYEEKMNINKKYAEKIVQKIGIDFEQTAREFGVTEKSIIAALSNPHTQLSHAIIDYCMEDEYFRVLVSNFIYDKIREYANEIPEDKFHHVKLLKL